MKNDSEHILKEHLAKLPGYDPPDELWDKLENVLDQDEKLGELVDAAKSNLPAYSPPKSVWDSIQSQLPEKTGRVVSVRRLVQYVAAAAIIGLGLVSLFQIWTRAGQEKVTMSYQTEAITLQATDDWKDWDDDETMIQMVAQKGRELAINNETTGLDELLSEMEELEGAREMLETALDRYGDDPDLVRQISDVERERTEVVKKISTFI